MLPGTFDYFKVSVILQFSTRNALLQAFFKFIRRHIALSMLSYFIVSNNNTEKLLYLSVSPEPITPSLIDLVRILSFSLSFLLLTMNYLPSYFSLSFLFIKFHVHEYIDKFIMRVLLKMRLKFLSSTKIKINYYKQHYNHKILAIDNCSQLLLMF